MTVRLPFALRPMLLKQRSEPFDGARWLFERKWDGWRALATVQDGRAMILSRNDGLCRSLSPGLSPGGVARSRGRGCLTSRRPRLTSLSQ